MARYRNREVTIDSYPVEEYKVTIVHEDSSRELVPLSQVTLNKQEAMEFLKLETAKIEQKKEQDTVANAEYVKATKANEEPKTVSMNPFSRKAAI